MEYEENVKRLVIARLESMPENIKLSIGNKGTFDKSLLIEHVRRGDDVGKKIIEMQLHYLRSFKKGLQSG